MVKLVETLKKYAEERVEEVQNKEDALIVLVALQVGVNTTSHDPDAQKAIKKLLIETTANFLCKPTFFQNYLDDIDRSYNSKDHVIDYNDIIENEDKLPFLNRSCIILEDHFTMTIFLVSLLINPETYYLCKEKEQENRDLFDEFLLQKLIRFINNYGVSDLPLSVQNADYIHKSWVEKSILEKYFPDDEISIYKLIQKIFTLKEFKKSKKTIIELMRGIPGNSDDWKTDLFSSLDKKFLDCEDFLFDVAKKGCNNWGIPFGYASERIKNNKLFAIKACGMSGSNITDFNEKFCADRDVVLAAICTYPDIYFHIDDVLKKDELIYNLALLNAETETIKSSYKQIYEDLQNS